MGSGPTPVLNGEVDWGLERVSSQDCKRRVTRAYLHFSFQANRLDVLCCIKLKMKNILSDEECLYSLIKNYYARFIMKNYVRPIIVSILFAFKQLVVLNVY